MVGLIGLVPVAKFLLTESITNITNTGLLLKAIIVAK